jgi:hypothetical protein
VEKPSLPLGLWTNRKKSARDLPSCMYYTTFSVISRQSINKEYMTDIVRSHEWECPQCGKMKDQIPESASSSSSGSTATPSLSTQQNIPTSSLVDDTMSAQEVVPAVQGSGVPLNPTAAAAPAISTDTPPTEDSTRLRPTPTTSAPVLIQTQARTQVVQRPAPVWIDAMILLGVAILVGLLYRKIGNSSNMIETVSL